jgi:hypothetical protein
MMPMAKQAGTKGITACNKLATSLQVTSKLIGKTCEEPQFL